MIETRLPPQFVTRMQHDLGTEWQPFLRAHEDMPLISVRLNPAKKSDLHHGTRIPWASDGYYLPERPTFTLDPTFHAGSYYVQEASSMLLEQVFLQHTDPHTTIRVLDLCAAPGGKSTHLISLMNPESLLVTNEVIRARATVLMENMQKWGYPNVVVTNNDPQDFQRLPGYFDIILVDAPCSGEGLFRKDPAAREAWSAEHAVHCEKRQQRILHDIWPALKADGVLIYSTCTYNAGENEVMIKGLQQDYGAESLPVKFHDNWGIQQKDSGGTFGYACYPHKVRGEGFFISAIRKAEPEALTRRKKSRSFEYPSRNLSARLAPWLTRPDDFAFIMRKEIIQCFPKHKLEDLELLAANLHLITAGTVMASVKHDKLIPEPPMALCVGLNKDYFEVIEVDLAEAIQFLRKDALKLVSDKKGFTLISYHDLPLGWVNMLGNRSNNLYPSEWRIRMQ